jgi:hypothetical protein
LPVAAGSYDYLPFTAYTATGVPLNVASKALFIAAGFDVVVWMNGVVVAAPTWDLVVVSGTLGHYEIKLTAQVGQGELRFTVPAGGYCTPYGFYLDYSVYSLDTLAAMFNQSQGQPGANTLSDWSLGDYKDGNTWNSGNITIPLAKMTVLGQTTLAGLTIEAASKTTPADTPTNWPTPTVIDSTNRIVQLTLASNTLTALGAGVRSLMLYVDLQLIKAGTPNKIVTVGAYTLQQLWRRDTRYS